MKFKKGYVVWSKDMSHSPETKAKIKETWKKKMENGYVGHRKGVIVPHSPETRKKIGIANKGKKRSPEQNKANSERLKGRKQTPELIAKRQATKRKKYEQGYRLPSQSSETRAKVKATWRKKRENGWISSNVGRKQSPEAIVKQKAMMKKKYDNGFVKSDFKGGPLVVYGRSWSTQKELALERAQGVSELSGKNGNRLSVHHIISMRDMHLWYMKTMYPYLYKLIGKKKMFWIFEKRYRVEHEHYEHFKGIPVRSLFPNSFYDTANNIDNLFVLTSKEHNKYGKMSPGFFEAVRIQNSINVEKI